jgi:hypothetical protein
LNYNKIEVIEELNSLTELRTLELAGNSITKLQGISNFHNVKFNFVIL